LINDEQSSNSTTRASGILLRAFDILLLKNPERTALGVMLGFSLDGLVSLFEPTLMDHHITLGHIGWWCYLSLGLVTVHLPFIFWSVRHKPVISDEIEGLIGLIEATNIGELEKRQAYRKVVNKCIDEFSLSSRFVSGQDTPDSSGKQDLKETLRQLLEG
jgi:hypothetical protein